MYDLKLLDDYVERGLLRKMEDEDLVQYSYSERTNNDGLWDEITMFNRGNIYEKKTGNLIAKAMPKFMNLGQLSQEKQKELSLKPKFNLTEKMDGCLGIIYKYKGEIRCNSRGGFDNYVTDKIKELLPKYVAKNMILNHNCLNVEVISPQTKIICDYGDTEELYLITAFYDRPNWVEHTYEESCMIAQVMQMPIVKEYHMSWEPLIKWQQEADWKHEGFVVRFPNNERVKIKSKDYLDVAKFRAGLSKRSIWRYMKNDLEQGTNQLQEYLNMGIPDEFSNIAKSYVKELEEEMEQHRQLAIKEYNELIDIPKNELHKYYKVHSNKYQHCNYALRDGKDITRNLIKMVEPEV